MTALGCEYVVSTLVDKGINTFFVLTGGVSVCLCVYGRGRTGTSPRG